MGNPEFFIVNLHLRRRQINTDRNLIATVLL